MSVFKRIQEIFSDQVILILAEPLQKNTDIVQIQNYEANDILFIPVFTSAEKLKESLHGHALENEVIKMQGSYFCSLLGGDEVIIINPDLDDEIRTGAVELRDLMKEQIGRENK